MPTAPIRSRRLRSPADRSGFANHTPRIRKAVIESGPPPSGRERRRFFDDAVASRSAVAEAVGGAFPLRHIVGDHAGGFHRGLAELGIAGDLALNALTFGVQQIAHAFEFRNQVFDLRKRSYS